MPITSRHPWTREHTLSTPDGGRLWVGVGGPEDGPTVVFCNGLGGSTLLWEPVAAALDCSYRVVLWDYRGHGRSGPAPTQGFGIRTCVSDLWTVVDALGLDRPVLAGHSLGVQVVLEAYRQAPDRIRALVPALGASGRMIETFFGTRLSVPALQLFRQVALTDVEATRRGLEFLRRSPLTAFLTRRLGLVHPTLFPRDRLDPFLQHLSTMDLHAYFQLAQDLQDHDASDVLADIAVPTLVFGADKDVFTPPRLSQDLARRIPGAELCLLRGGTHAAIVEQSELVALRLERFFVDRLGWRRLSVVPSRPVA